jgi:hypothetical protein
MMAGRNACEVSENTPRIVVHTSGTVSSATAYQRTPTRHRNKRDRRSRKPTLPKAMAITRMPAPAKMRGPGRMDSHPNRPTPAADVSSSSPVPSKPPVPRKATMMNPGTHESANTSM